MAPKQEGDELRLLVFELFNEYERLGTLDNIDTIYKVAKATQMSNAQAEVWRQKYKNERARMKEESIGLQHQEIKTQYDTQKMTMDICPNCMNLRTQLADKDRDFRETKKDLKQDLREARLQLEDYKSNNFKLLKSESEAITFKARVQQLEQLVNDLRTRLDSEKDNRHSLEVQKSVLEVKNEMISKREPDEEITLLRKMIYDKGFARMTGDDPSSETLQVIRSIGEMAPNVIKEGATLISEIRSDKDPNSNPYPQGDQNYMKHQQKQQRQRQIQQQRQQQQQQQQRQQPQQQQRPQQQQQPQQQPEPHENLNKLGRAFSKKYPQIPLDLIGPVSEHIYSVYQHLKPNQMAMLMNDTFIVITNLREAGVHIKNMMAGKNYPLINRALTPPDAAEILWKEQRLFAEKLKDMTYEELIGLLYPIREHATYGKDVDFFKRPEVETIIEKILVEIRKYGPQEEESSSEEELWRMELSDDGRPVEE